MTQGNIRPNHSGTQQWLLALVLGVSQLGSTVVLFSVAALLVEQQRLQDLTLVFACTTLAAPVAHLWGGLIVDALPGAKRVFLTGAAVACLTQAALAALTHHYGTPLGLLVPFLMTVKFASAVASSSAQRLIRSTTPTTHIPQTVATVSLLKTVGMVAAPVVATFLAIYANLSTALTFDAITYLLAITLIAGLAEKQTSTPPRQTMLTRIAEGAKFCRSTPGLPAVIAVDLIACGLWSVSFNVGLQSIALTTANGRSIWGAIATTSVVGILIGGLIARRRSPNQPFTWAMIGSIGTALPIAAVLAPWGSAGIIAATFIGYCGIGCASAWSSVGLQKLVPEHLLGRVFALSIATQLAAPPVVGFTTRTLHLDFRDLPVQVFFAGALLIVHLIGIPAARKVDHVASAQKQTPAAD